MTAREIPEEHNIARAAQHAVEGQLAPCISTRLGQGDDYGLDAFVQHVLPGRPPTRTSLLFGLQVKGSLDKFKAHHIESLRVTHLEDWISCQVPVVIAVNSINSNATRWRTARDILDEVRQTREDWQSQKTVSVTFHEEHELKDDDLQRWLKTELLETSDPDGGKLHFHKNFRSVLLTEIYHKEAFTGQHFGIAKAPNGIIIADCVTGMQWVKGEIDETTVDATKVLIASLLLFDQIYYPALSTSAAVGALGPNEFEKLVVARRLIPVTLENNSELAFVLGKKWDGGLAFLASQDYDLLDRHLDFISAQYNLRDAFARIIKRATRRIKLPGKVESEVSTVSQTPYIRDLLGLGRLKASPGEAPWSAERLLRIGNVVKFYAIAENLHVDVVEFEPGLARIALARWGSQVHFHRIYQALDELQAALDASALPDMGHLASKVGVKRCIEISNSKEGSKFREWYWSVAAQSLSVAGNINGEIASRLKSLIGIDCPLPADFLIHASTDGTKDEVLATRPGGEAALIRQKRFNALRLIKSLNYYNGKVPSLAEECPCNSNQNFGNCCGKILS